MPTDREASETDAGEEDLEPCDEAEFGFFGKMLEPERLATRIRFHQGDREADGVIVARFATDEDNLETCLFGLGLECLPIRREG